MINNRLGELRNAEQPPFVYGSSYHGGTWARTKEAYQSIAMSSPTGQLEALRTLLEENEKVKRFGFNKGEFERAKKSILSRYEKNMMNGYVNGSEDIPLVKKLVQIDSGHLGFDSSSGSISMTTYRSWEDLDKVKDFYIRTLPQLGWRLLEERMEGLIFLRGKEKVEITFVNENGDDLVKFFVYSTL